MTDGAENQSILSKRAQKILDDLCFKLTDEVELLSAQYSLLVGSMMACDLNTQYAMMIDYRAQLHAVHTVLGQLCVAIDKQSDETGPLQS